MRHTLTRSHFQLSSSQIKTVLLGEKIGCIVRAEIRANAETNCCCWGLAPQEMRRVRCTARRNQASESTLTASGLAAKRRAECAT